MSNYKSMVRSLKGMIAKLEKSNPNSDLAIAATKQLEKINMRHDRAMLPEFSSEKVRVSRACTLDVNTLISMINLFVIHQSKTDQSTHNQ